MSSRWGSWIAAGAHALANLLYTSAVLATVIVPIGAAAAPIARAVPIATPAATSVTTVMPNVTAPPEGGLTSTATASAPLQSRETPTPSAPPQSQEAPTPRDPIGPDPGAGFVRLPGHIPGALASATPLSAQTIPGGTNTSTGASTGTGTGTGTTATTASAPMTLTLVLKRDDPAAFDRYMRDVYDPNSKHFRHFLTQTQLTRQFGPSRQTYRSVLDYLQQNGFELVEGSNNRLTLTVRGTRSQVERAFELRVGDYRLGEQAFYANSSDPALPADLAGHIQGIAGLSNLAFPKPGIALILAFCAAAVSLMGLNAFNMGNAAAASAKTAATLEAEFAAAAASSAAKAAGAGAVAGGVVCAFAALGTAAGDYLDNATGGPAPGPPPQLGPRPWVGRAWNGFNGWLNSLGDQPVQGVSGRDKSMRPGTKAAQASTPGNNPAQTIGLVEFDTFNTSDVVNFLAYLGAPASQIDDLTQVPVNGGVATPGSGESEVLLDIEAALTIAPGAKVVVYDAPFTGRATDYSAVFNAMINGGVTVISNSWASCEDQVSQADAQAIDAVLQTAAASGISVFNGTGDSGSTCLDGSPNTISVPADSPNATAVGGTSLTFGPGYTYGSETWWNGTNAVPPTGQGGYGVSRYFAVPSYQSALNSGSGRSVPDVSMNADPISGFFLCQADAGGCPTGGAYGGTSLATPVWAAIAAMINNRVGKNLGAYNLQLYPLAGSAGFHNAASMGSDFAHVGLGSPDIDNLSLLLAGQTVGTVDANVSSLGQFTDIGPSGNTVVAVPAISADGKTTGVITATLYDSNGNAVAGKSVSLATQSGTTATVSPASVTTNSNGSANFLVTDLNPEVLTLTATDTTDGIQLAQTTGLIFVAPSASSASLTTFPTAVPADGSSTTTLTVVLKDSLGRASTGKIVNISQGTGHAVITGPTPAVTDTNGQIQFTATDDTNESVAFAATDASDGNLPVPGSGAVTFSGATASDCTDNPATGANGYTVTTFATGFPASDFNYSNINLSGCPGVGNPYFTSAGTVLLPDFRTGDLYQLGLSGGAVTSGNVLVNLDPTVGTPVPGLDGNIYASRFATGNGFYSGDVIQIDPTTGAIVRELATGLTCPNSLVVDPLSGDLFFDDQCTGGGSDNPSVFRISGPGGTNPTVSTYASLPVGGGQQQLAFAPNGTLFAVSGGAGNAAEVVQIGGTNTPAPPVVTALSGITPDNGSVAIGQTNADGSTKTLLLHVTGTNGGSLETVDVTTSTPTVVTVLATGDIGAGVVGPDGCYYIGDHHVVYKLAPSTGVCSLTSSNPIASLTLSPGTVSPNPVQGITQTFTAVLKNSNPLSGVPVRFLVGGANPQIKQILTDATGTAVMTYSALNAGNDTVRAVATANTAASTSASVVSNIAQVTWTAGAHTTFLALNQSATGGSVNTAITVTATLADVSATPTAAVAGQTVNFTLGTANCSAVTGANGTATCQLTPAQPGAGTLTATFAGTGQFASTTNSVTFNTVGTGAVPTVSISVGPQSIAAGSTAALTWSTTNATACTASGSWSGTEPTNGTLSVTPATSGTFTYTLTCSGNGGTAAASAVLSATLVAVKVTAKSGGGAIDWRLVMLLAFLVILRSGTAWRRRGLAVCLCLGLTLAAGSLTPARADEAATPTDQHSDPLDSLYVGIRAGIMPLELNTGKIEQRLANDGYNTMQVTRDSSAAAGTVYLGYEFAPHMDLELGYSYRDANIVGLTGTQASAADVGPVAKDTTEVLNGYGSIYSLSYRGRMEPLPRLMIDPRLGAFFWQTTVRADASGINESTTHSGGGVTVGIGAAYRLWRGLEIGVGVDYFRGSQDNVATLYSGSLEWRFGAQ
jgi:hypothetical protein